jgi:hypothetical protein
MDHCRRSRTPELRKGSLDRVAKGFELDSRRVNASPTRTNAYGWERWSPVAGLLYVLLFVIAIVTTPDTGETNREILEHYADEGNRRNDIILTFLFAAAALAFFWFASDLRSRLAAVAPLSALPTLALGAGIASAGLLLVAAATFGSISFTYEEGDFELDPNTARLVGSIGYGAFVGSMWMAGLVVLATSLVAFRTRVLPAWLAWLGILVTIALVFAFAFFPVFALLVWVAVVSVVLLARPPTLASSTD